MANLENADKYNLKRFVDAQECMYEAALREVASGRKHSHWMWYVFPQLAELGRSQTAKYYGISGICEARAFLEHEVLSRRLREICKALLACGSNNAREVFGHPDDLKLRSSMTLFEAADPEESVFGEVLDAFFRGERDEETIRLLSYERNIEADPQESEDYLKAKREIERREMFLSKIQGALIGGAVGDALGYAVEFMSVDEIHRTFGPDCIMEYKLDGQGMARFSDDTQMTLFTANALLIGDTRGCMRGVGGPYASYCNKTYLDWLYTQDHSFHGYPDVSWLLTVKELHKRRAPGNTCLAACRTGFGSIENPANNSKGCGGVMRVAPIGLYWVNYRYCNGEDLLDFVVQDAAECAALTHGHPLGYISAGAFAYIVNRIAYEIPEDCDRRLGMLQEIVDDCCASLARWFPDHAADAGYQAALLQRACRLAGRSGEDSDLITEIGEGWVGEEMLAVAVFACLRHPNDFSAAVRAAVNHSGDSDSTGSVCGNIMGAMLGLDAIGAEWTERLELFDLIMEVAKDLCDVCQMEEYCSYYDEVWWSKYGR